MVASAGGITGAAHTDSLLQIGRVFAGARRLLVDCPSKPATERDQGSSVRQSERNFACLLVDSGVWIGLAWSLDNLNATHSTIPEEERLDREAVPGGTPGRVPHTTHLPFWGEWSGDQGWPAGGRASRATRGACVGGAASPGAPRARRRSDTRRCHRNVGAHVISHFLARALSQPFTRSNASALT
jgi:hypothetical protein